MSVTVLANGCWDIFHIGHLLHLEAARKMGDRLVVSVTHDAFVNKGPNRPTFNHGQRSAIVGALKCVDEVLIVRGVLEALEIVKPDIFVKGPDYEDKIEVEHAIYCEKKGIKIAFTSEPLFSSTKIIHDRLKYG